MSQEKLQRPGQFVLDVCTLHTSGNAVIDLKGGANVMHITFFEDMLTPYVQGSIVIQNQGGASNIGPIIGQETLELVIRTPTMKEDHEILSFTGKNRLHITRINSKRRIGKGTEFISLEFFSGEWVRNSRTRISKTLRGSVSNIANTLLNDVGCFKKRYIESSGENKQYIAPNIRPFDAINHLIGQAVSTGGGDHPERSFLFWENKRGFHFRSLSSIVKGNTDVTNKDLPTHFYRHKDKVKYDKGGAIDVIDRLYAITDFETRHSDRFHNHIMGQLGSSLISHNMYTKSYARTNFNYLDQFNRWTHMNSHKRPKSTYPIYSESPDVFGKRVSDYETKTFLYPENQNQAGFDAGMQDPNGNYIYSPYESHAWVQKRRGQLGILFGGVSISLFAHGNTFVNAGDMVDVTLPYFGIKDADNPTGKDRFLNGNMLVHQIAHEFDVANFEHKMKLECVSDDLEEELPKTDEDSPEGELSPKNEEIYEDFYL
tara:strand:- start:1436 stop:2893 length:1458 start_codon:yes stop_codon:yes gene_type:complete